MNIGSGPATSSIVPNVDIVLSRPAYGLGNTIVGTIRIRHHQSAILASCNPISNEGPTLPPLPPLRSIITNAVVYVAGFCRIDPRWHNVSQYSKMYGKKHPQLEELYKIFHPTLLSQGSTNDDTVCFWATQGLQLLELNERPVGTWPYLLNKNKDNTTTTNNNNSNKYVHDQLIFTFRVDIPKDLPHSMNATTCRYFYTAEVLIKAKPTPTSTLISQKVVKAPFAVWSHSILGDNNSNNMKGRLTSGRVQIGICYGMAHSIGLPCHLSSTEIHRPRGQMTVRPMRTTNTTPADEHTATTEAATTMLRVSNSEGRPVCLLNVIGATTATPGSRIHIQWDFPEEEYIRHTTTNNNNNNTNTNNNWVPCYQVSACLLGDEFAIYEDGTTKRTRSFIFDTCHELVDPGVTDQICKTLLLPIDAPCTLKTDVMEMSITCQIDITVQEGSINNEKYNNLQLQLPCHVVHTLEHSNPHYIGEEICDDDENLHVVPIHQLLYGDIHKNSNEFSSSSSSPSKQHNYHYQEEPFQTDDILPELKILSLQMEQALQEEFEEQELLLQQQNYPKLPVV